MIAQVDLLSYIFWKKLKTQKRHFEINRPLVTFTFLLFKLTNCRWNNHQKNVILLDFTRSGMTWVNFHHLLLQTVVFNKVEFLFFPGKFRDAAMRKMTSRDNTNRTKGKAKFQVSTNIYFMEMNNHDNQNNRHSKL